MSLHSVVARHVWIVLGILVLAGLVMASPSITGDVPNLNGDASREIGGALIAGAVVGAVLLLWEEGLEGRRTEHDKRLAEAQAKRDEWTALMIQMASLGVNLVQLDLRGRDLHGLLVPNKANLGASQFNKANLRRAYLRHTHVGDSSFCGADLSGANLSGLNGSNVNFSDAILAGADFTDAQLGNPVFCGVDFGGVRLDGARFDVADLTGAKLEGAIIETRVTLVSPIGLDEDVVMPPGWVVTWQR